MKQKMGKRVEKQGRGHKIIFAYIQIKQRLEKLYKFFAVLGKRWSKKFKYLNEMSVTFVIKNEN